MRKLIYFVRASLDARIAGAEGALDRLFDPNDEAVAAFLPRVDTVLVGTAAYNYMAAKGHQGYPGLRTYVLSRTVQQPERDDVTVIPEDPAPFTAALKNREGGDIWLLGGGVVFRYLLQAGLVDEIIVLLHPVLLGGGVPLLPESDQTTGLELRDMERQEDGVVRLRYDVLTRSVRENGPERANPPGS